jgi:hypothetical protein
MDDLTFETLKLDAETERLAREKMSDHGCGVPEALYLVALDRGNVFGGGDLVCIGPPLTAEQRRLTGLDHDPEQVMAETRARVMARRAENSGDSGN